MSHHQISDRKIYAVKKSGKCKELRHYRDHPFIILKPIENPNINLTIYKSNKAIGLKHMQGLKIIDSKYLLLRARYYIYRLIDC